MNSILGSLWKFPIYTRPRAKQPRTFVSKENYRVSYTTYELKSSKKISPYLRGNENAYEVSFQLGDFAEVTQR